MADQESRRFTITITPITPDELQQVVGDLRARFGQKPLIHVIGNQHHGTNLHDAPGAETLCLRSELQRLLSTTEALVREVEDPGTEALAAVYTARQALAKTPT